jgi:catechol 2,3-dioxygenase-like lactoylglutathione lyase family enzyme
MERAVPVLPTEDLAAARQFYVNGLGFRAVWEASADGRTGMMGVARGTIALTLDCPMDGHGRKACVSLEVDDADAYYKEWSARVAVERPPVNEPWGARTFSVHDPSGNTIFVMGPVVDPAEND